ncbi:Uncharacterised protein [uncultured archaeon]|nr:Uncharacterised protein [uncultured archaeon]
MKICAIKHNSLNEDFEIFKNKLISAVGTNSDIIIGPYDSFGRGLSTKERKEEVYNQVQNLSSKCDSLIIPGTISYPINEREMVCESPVFHMGNLLNVFCKEKDNGEEKLAEENGYIYKRGNNSKNRFYFKGKEIAVELCGDHGVQDVKGCDLELILAFDSRAGFWINASNDNLKRKAIVCDGYAPKVEVFDYNPERRDKLRFVPSEEENSLVTAFV